MDDVLSNLDLVAEAFWLTIQLFVLSGVLSLALGTLLAGMRVGPVWALAKAGAAYVTLLRNTPLLVVFIFVFFGLPKLDIQLPFLVKGVLALTLYTSAFVCEALRSGINSVSLGQAEASRAIGLTFLQSMQLVILPQALRAVVPPMASVLIALAKNTSVGAGFGLAEAAFRMRFFVTDNNDKLAIFVFFAVGYVILVELVSAGASLLERRWKVAR